MGFLLHLITLLILLLGLQLLLFFFVCGQILLDICNKKQKNGYFYCFVAFLIETLRPIPFHFLNAIVQTWAAFKTMRWKENAHQLKVFVCISSLKLTYIFFFFCGFHGSMPSVVLWGSALISGRPGRRVVSWFNAHVWLLQLHTHWVVTGLNQFHSCAADLAYRCSKGTACWFSCATQNTIVCLHFGHSFL